MLSLRQRRRPVRRSGGIVRADVAEVEPQPSVSLTAHRREGRNHLGAGPRNESEAAWGAAVLLTRTTCGPLTSTAIPARTSPPGTTAGTTASACFLRSVEVSALATGTSCGATCSKRHLPAVTALRTLESSHLSHFYLSSFDSQRRTFDQRGGHFAAGGLDDPPKGGSRDPHVSRRLLLIKPFVVGQAQGFVFVERKFDFLQAAIGHARRLEHACAGRRGDSSATFRSSHLRQLLTARRRW